jgi:hypothetical protein
MKTKYMNQAILTFFSLSLLATERKPQKSPLFQLFEFIISRLSKRLLTTYRSIIDFLATS